MPTRLRRVSLLVIGTQLLSIAAPAFAAPIGGSVASGTVAIDQAGNVTQVRQSTDRAIINWQGFSTKAHETVQFQQPSAAAVTLNRVVSSQASSLAGSLNANGKVFLVNPNGIVFGATSRVHAGSLVASTLAISDADFKRGNYAFSQDTSKPLASVVNKGHIETSAGGTVALVAPVVENRGTIVAPGGRVALAAGSKAQVNLDTGLVTLEATGAPARDVVYGTDGAANPLADAVNNGALAEAGGVSTVNGRVVLHGAEGRLVQSGRISVDGPTAGSIRLDSTHKTTLTAGSVTSASSTAVGATGGTIHVLSQARAVTAPTSLVSARGGRGGRGGFVDVSAKHVVIDGDVDTRAPGGKTGTFLIDPETLTIVNESGDLDEAIVPVALPTAVVPTAPLVSLPGTATGSSVSVVRLNALALTNDIVLEATSQILFANTSTIDMNGHSLTLKVTPGAGGGLGNVRADAVSTVNNARDFTILAGTEANPGTKGFVDLTKLTVLASGDISIDVRSTDSTRGVAIGQLVTPTGTVTINVPGGSILDGEPGSTAINVVARHATLNAQSIAPHAVGANDLEDVDVNVSGTLSLTVDEHAVLHNEGLAQKLIVSVDELQPDILSVRQASSELSVDATRGVLFTSPTGGGANLELVVRGAGNELKLTNVATGTGDLALKANGGGIFGGIATTGALGITSTGGSAIDLSNNGIASSTSILIDQLTAGSIHLGQTGSTLESTSGLALSAPSSRTLSVRTKFGDLSVGRIDAGETSVELHAESGSILTDADAPITAGSLTAVAANDFGSTDHAIPLAVSGLVAIKLTGSASAIHANLLTPPSLVDLTMVSAGQNIDIQQAGAAVLVQSAVTPLSTLTPATFDLALSVDTGNLQLGHLDFTGQNLTLQSQDGGIRFTPEGKVSAGNLMLVAPDDILSTLGRAGSIDAETLTLTTDGSAAVVDATGLALAKVTTGGNLEITTLDGDLVFGNTTNVAGKASFAAKNALTSILFDAGAVLSVGGDLALSAGNNIQLVMTSLGGNLSLQTGTGSEHSIDAVLADLPQNLTIHEGLAGGAISIRSGGGGPILQRVAGGALTTLTPLATNLSLELDLGDLVLGSMTLASSTFAGGSTFDLDAQATDGSILGAGAVVVAGNLSLRAQHDINLATQAKTLRATATKGSVTIAETDTVAVHGVTAFTAVDLAAGGDIQLQSAITAGTTARLAAQGDIKDGATTASLIRGPTVHLSGRNIGSALRGVKIAATTLDAEATGGDVFVLGTGDLALRDVSASGVVSIAALGGLSVDTVASGSGVRLVARGGGITDANGDELNLSSTSPGGAFLTAQTGIGDLIQPLGTQVSLIEAITAAGDIVITNTGHVVLTAVTRASGDIVATVNNGWFVLNTARAFGGDVALIAPQGGILDNAGTIFNVIAERLTLELGATAGSSLSTLGTRVEELDADAFGVFVDNTGDLRVRSLTSTGSNLIRSSGDIALGRLESTGGAIDVVSTGGSILDGNGRVLNLVVSSGFQSRLIASGTVGARDAIGVDLGPGSLAVAAGDSVNGVSARIAGNIDPDGTVLGLGAPGSILFNGRIAALGDVDAGPPSQLGGFSQRRRSEGAVDTP